MLLPPSDCRLHHKWKDHENHDPTFQTMAFVITRRKLHPKMQIRGLKGSPIDQTTCEWSPHTNKKIRIKAAVFLAQRLYNNTPYFVNLRGRSADTPLPAPSAELTGLCEAFLTRCRDVLLGRRRAFHLEDYTKWASHNAAPVIPYSPDSQQPTYSAAPQTATPLPEPYSATTLPAAPLAPIPATATTEPSPPQSTSSVSAFTQAIPPLADFASEILWAASDIWMESPRDTTTPMAVDPNPVPPSTHPVDPTTSGDAASRPSNARPITSTTKDRLIAPLISCPRDLLPTPT